MRLGIIGGGTVGRATARCYIEHHEVRVCDKLKERSTHSLEEALDSDLVFLCLPESELIAFFAEVEYNVRTNFVIKSTVPIGTTRRLAGDFKLPHLVHSPEFLTSRCSLVDAQLPARNIIGAPGFDGHIRWNDGAPCRDRLVDLYSERFPGVPIYMVSSDESEAIKLMTNSFFAVKIACFNEFRALADRLHLDWGHVLPGILSDGRIAHSHTRVPGPDGKRGFGGICLPKDLRMLVEALGEEARVTEAALSRNERFDRRSE